MEFPVTKYTQPPLCPPCHLFFFLVFQAKISKSAYFLRGDSKFEIGDGKCSLDVNLCTITLSSYISEQWVISYQWQRCSAEQAICIWHWSKQNIARLTQVKNGGREDWHTIFTTYIPFTGSKLCSWLIFS